MKFENTIVLISRTFIIQEKTFKTCTSTFVDLKTVKLTNPLPFLGPGFGPASAGEQGIHQ